MNIPDIESPEKYNDLMIMYLSINSTNLPLYVSLFPPTVDSLTREYLVILQWGSDEVNNCCSSVFDIVISFLFGLILKIN